jgi:hypothetical protein
VFRIIYLARRNPKIPEDGFSEAWQSHSKLASTLKNTMGNHFARVRQCIKVYGAEVPGEYVNNHDGAGMMTLKSWDDLLKARYHKDAVSVMHDDEPRVFFDYCESFTMAAEESLIMKKAEGSAALLHFVKRRSDVDPCKFEHYWRNTHADSMLGLDLIKLSAVNLALNRVIDTPGPDYDFAGISELWFDNIEQARVASWDGELRSTMGRLEAVADTAKTVSMLIRLNFEKRPGAGLNP